MQILSRYFLNLAALALFIFATGFINPVFSKPLAEPKGIADGPGIWVNLWSHPKDGDINSYCLKLHNHGIRNVFIQTSRSNTEAIRNPGGLAKLIERCHHYKIRVIAWSFLMLDNPEADAKKLIDAAQFKTPGGHKFDSVAANIEKDLSPWKVEKLSVALREKLGQDYPLIAVVFSPLNKAPQVAKTPWKMLDKYYDVIAPMNYWNSKYADFDPYDYTRDTVKKVRELVGRPDVEIHVIGDGMKTHADEIHQFMKACHDNGATSASLYPFHQVTEEQYKCMSRYSDYFPTNARFSLAAFRELRKQGTFVSCSDPSKPISRIEFFKPVMERLSAKNNLSSGQVKELVLNLKLVKPQRLNGDGIYSSIGHREAYDLIARAVDLNSKIDTKGKDKLSLIDRIVMKSNNRGDSWLIQPAFAATRVKKSHQPLNYLEASRLILSADSLLR